VGLLNDPGERTALFQLAKKNRWRRMVASVLLWTTIGVLFALPGILSANQRHPLLSSLIQWWSWGLVVPIIFWADGWLPFKEKQLGMRILAHLVVSVALTIFYFYVFMTLRACVGLTTWSELAGIGLSNAFRGGLMWSWLVYWAIFGVRQTFRYYGHYVASELRLERMERNFTQARLNALRMQLDPHFLFNALNTISSQVERDPRIARSMLEHLGDLLRLSLNARDRQEIPLAEELAFLEHYLAIQKIRFGNNLRVEMRIAPDVKYALVPCLIVQPLVENAIRHGISLRSSGGTVQVVAERIADRVEIRITDDGVGLPAGWSLESNGGLGLSVTKERVAGLHPNGNSRFVVQNRTGGGAEVAISFPLRLTGEPLNGFAH
jgi:two-component system, LytTR family, sensor kinase